MHFASGFLKIRLLWRTMNGYRKISLLMRDMTTSYYLERMCFNLRFYNFWRIFIEEFQKIWSLSLSIEHGEIFAKSTGKLVKNNQLIKRISKIVLLNWFEYCCSLILPNLFSKFAMTVIDQDYLLHTNFTLFDFQQLSFNIDLFPT